MGRLLLSLKRMRPLRSPALSTPIQVSLPHAASRRDAAVPMRPWWYRHAPELMFAALLLLGAAIILYETRGFTFYFDDWDFVLHRRGLSPNVLLVPHGPHLTLVPILIYKVLLKLFGASYLPFRILAALDLVLLGLALGFVCRMTWGRWWALAPVLLMVTLGSGAWTLLWSFQVGYSIAIAAGAIALVALTRDSRTGDAVACTALILSLASGSQGIGFTVGAALIVALGRNCRRRAWVIVIPALLYGAWYVKYGHQASETQLALWRSALPYTMTSFASTVSGLLGLGSPSTALPPQIDPSFGHPLALAAIVAVIVALWRGWRPSALFWGAALTLVVLWVAAALDNRYGSRLATDSRYLPTSAFLLMVCLCLALPAPRLGRPAVIAVMLALVVIAVTNAGQFTPMRTQMEATSVADKAELGAMMIMRGLLPAGFTPAPPFGVGLANEIQAGPFFSAFDAFGGFAFDTPAQLQRSDPGTRQLADQVIDRGELLGFSFGSAPRPSGKLPTVIGGHATPQGGCLALSGGHVAIDAVPGTYVLRASRAALGAAIGRFATTYDISLGVIPRGRTATVHIPADRAPHIPWRMLVNGAGSLCT